MPGDQAAGGRPRQARRHQRRRVGPGWCAEVAQRGCCGRGQASQLLRAPRQVKRRLRCHAGLALQVFDQAGMAQHPFIRRVGCRALTGAGLAAAQVLPLQRRPLRLRHRRRQLPGQALRQHRGVRVCGQPILRSRQLRRQRLGAADALELGQLGGSLALRGVGLALRVPCGLQLRLAARPVLGAQGVVAQALAGVGPTLQRLVERTGGGLALGGLLVALAQQGGAQVGGAAHPSGAGQQGVGQGAAGVQQLPSAAPQAGGVECEQPLQPGPVHAAQQAVQQGRRQRRIVGADQGVAEALAAAEGDGSVGTGGLRPQAHGGVAVAEPHRGLAGHAEQQVGERLAQHGLAGAVGGHDEVDHAGRRVERQPCALQVAVPFDVQAGQPHGGRRRLKVIASRRCGLAVRADGRGPCGRGIAVLHGLPAMTA